MLKKIFLGLLALSFIVFGLFVTTVVFVFKNPDKTWNFVLDKVSKSFESVPHTEEAEFLVNGYKSIEISSKSHDLSFRPYEGDTLKMKIADEVLDIPEFPLIQEKIENGILKIQIVDPPINSSFSFSFNGESLNSFDGVDLKVEILFPKKLLSQLAVFNERGQVNLNIDNQDLYELEIATEGGFVENAYRFSGDITSATKTGTVIPQISIKTLSGPVNIISK